MDGPRFAFFCTAFLEPACGMVEQAEECIRIPKFLTKERICRIG